MLLPTNNQPGRHSTEFAAANYLYGHLIRVRRPRDVCESHETVELHPKKRHSDDPVPRIKGADESIDERIRASHGGGHEQVDRVQRLICG
jgi:hypothetical protein